MADRRRGPREPRHGREVRGWLPRRARLVGHVVEVVTLIDRCDLPGSRHCVSPPARAGRPRDERLRALGYVE
jgi:hypothetical protein